MDFDLTLEQQMMVETAEQISLGDAVPLLDRHLGDLGNDLRADLHFANSFHVTRRLNEPDDQTLLRTRGVNGQRHVFRDVHNRLAVRFSANLAQREYPRTNRRQKNQRK